MTHILIPATIAILACLVALRVAATAIHAVTVFLRHFRPLALFLAGHPMDGKRRTDATFLQAPNKPLYPAAEKSWWHWRPGWQRAAIRVAAVTTGFAVTAGLVAATAVTLAALLAVTLVAAGLAVRMSWLRLRHFRHDWHHVRPLRRTLTARLGQRPANVEVAVRDGVVRSVAIAWKPEAEIGRMEKEITLDAVTTRLPIEAPDERWKLTGRNRSVLLTRSEPPPFPVSWDDIAPAVQAAEPNELVFGPGKRAAVSKAAYGESPHVKIPGGSGGGKSNLAAFLLLQELVRGSLIINLDPKWISHLWLQGLPNVINAHDIPDIHLALCWLGRELLRRTKVAWYSAGGTGRVRGNVGPRVIVLAEELGYGMPGLKDHWREIRGRDGARQSPAIAGLSALACAGRASDMHIWLIAQLMTVASTGISDSTIRTNCGITAMTRWDEPGWRMSVGKHIPMPPPNTIPGRIQLVTGDVPRETQVPYLHLDDKDTAVSDKAVAWARELAVSGTVAEIPTGPEGIPEQLWPASVRPTPRLALPPGQSAGTRPTVIPPADLTIIEAVQEGIIFGELNLGAARRRVNRAGIEPAGRRGDGQYTYARADLFAAARDKRRKDTPA